MTDTLRVLVIGAHPDDCDIRAGGVAAKYADRGHDVRFVSMTNGDAGHHEIGGVELARRRRAEAAAAAETIGIDYVVLENHDGELTPTLDRRKCLIRTIREYDPDLVLTHRPNDYHPDHRYTSTLVQDAAYMVTVPNVCTGTPALEDDPVICYLSDGFEKPAPFEPDVVVDIDDVVAEKFDMFHCHESQFYEWLPHNGGYAEDVPDGDEERRDWLTEQRRGGAGATVADRFRDQLRERYGEERGDAVEFAEAFEECEYGSPLTVERERELFPFYSDN